MTTLEQQSQNQSRITPTQTGDDQQHRQAQQQNSDTRSNADRQQSAQEEESFTISADDLMMA